MHCNGLCVSYSTKLVANFPYNALSCKGREHDSTISHDNNDDFFHNFLFKFIKLSARGIILFFLNLAFACTTFRKTWLHGNCWHYCVVRDVMLWHPICFSFISTLLRPCNRFDSTHKNRCENWTSQLFCMRNMHR